jgi:glycine/D-amino acid oxidase-like deaminating enzyme
MRVALPRIALVAPFSGPRAAWGQLLTEAVRALPYQQVTWEFFDDLGDTETAERCAARIAGDGFAAVIGHFNSTGAALVLPVYQAAGLAFLLPLATAPGLLRAAPGAGLRFCPADEGQAAAMVAAWRNEGTARLSVRDDGSPYGRRIAELVKALAAGHTPAAGATGETVALLGVHHTVARIATGIGGDSTILVPDDCDIPEFATMVGAVADRLRVARLTGGPAARVTAACAAAAGALTKHPQERGAALLRRIRGETGLQFDADGELLSNDDSWELRALPRPAAPASRYDVAVAGGGIIGRMAAADLAQAGATVALIDPDEPARSASYPSGGLVRAFEAEAGHRALACQSFVRLWGVAHAAAYGFRRTGSLVLLSPQHLAEAEQGIAELGRAGVEAHLLSAGQVRQRWPALTVSGAAVWEPMGGYVVAPVVLAAQLDRALALGVEHHAGVTVSTVDAQEDGSSRLRCADRTVAAEVTLIAAGVGSPALAGAGWPASRLAATKRIRFAVFARGGLDLPTLMDMRTGVWGRPDGDGGYLAGCPIDDWDVPDDSGAGIEPGHLTAIRAAVSELCPRLGAAEVLFTRYGTDLFAPAPVLERSPGPHRMVVAAGWSGGGFKSAPAAASRAASLALAALAGQEPHRSVNPREMVSSLADGYQRK